VGCAIHQNVETSKFDRAELKKSLHIVGSADIYLKFLDMTKRGKLLMKLFG
jgi:hypothetical protein